MFDVQNNFSLEKATDAVLKLKDDIGKGCIALGKWIALTKENIPRKEYLDWLRYEVKIHEKTALRFMKISEEIDYQTLERLGTSKVFEILSLPDDEFKKQLVEKAENMTVKEIREEKKKHKEDMNASPEVEEGEVEELPNDAEDAMQKNIYFLETLDRIDIGVIPETYIGLLKSQLQKNLKDVTGFLQRLDVARQK